MNSHCLKEMDNKVSKKIIEQSLNEINTEKSIDVFVFDEIDSTNQWLINHLPNKDENEFLCVAESQTSGRGRSGRHWVSPSNSNIYMSFSYRSAIKRRDMSALSLIVGLALVRVLKNKGVSGVGLKWPNDVLLNGKKLAGMLIEAKVKQDCLYFVIGVGININMSADTVIESDIGWIDLSSKGVGLADRNELIALFYNECSSLVSSFLNDGFAALRDEWISCDQFFGKEIQIIDQGMVMLTGKSLGVDDGGCLLVQSGSSVKKIITGDVSLRSNDEK